MSVSRSHPILGRMKHTKPVYHNIELNCYQLHFDNGQIGYINLYDFYILFNYNFYTLKAGNTYYLVSNCKNKNERYIHRMIMNPPDELSIDHRNRNGLDNRRYNIRLATHSENMRNKRVYKNNKSGYTGVKLEKGHNKSDYWKAEIKTLEKDIRGRSIRKSKSFSINKYGYEESKRMAINWVEDNRVVF